MVTVIVTVPDNLRNYGKGLSFQVRAPGQQATHAYQLDSQLQSLGKEQFINEKPPFQNFSETKGQIRLIGTKGQIRLTGRY